MKKTIPLITLLRKRPLMLVTISSVILFTFVLHGCKKNDFSAIQPTHDADFVQKFFALKHPVNDTAARFIAKLKAKHERTGFVNELPANCGLPVWDKLLLKAQNNHPAFTAGDDDDTTIVIPLTNTNASLSGVLVAQPVADSFIIKCYTNNWLYNICHATSIDTNYANESLALFMYMENQTFGTQTFYHIPAALIADGPALPDSNGTKTVTIADVTPPTEGFIINTVCIDITCPPSIAIGCIPKTVCISVPGDGAPAGGGDGTPGSGNTGTSGGQSGGGSGGNGNGPGGNTACPLTTNVTWYGLMPPPDPCGGTTTPIPIPAADTLLNPCDVVAELGANQVFKNMMNDLKSHAINPADTTEYGYIYDYAPNSLALSAIQGEPGVKGLPDVDPGAGCNGVAHDHFINSLSVFSPNDLWSMSSLFNNKQMYDSSTFTFPLVTNAGTQYMLTIRNITKFRNWARQFTNGNLKVYKDLYGDYYLINETNTNEQNELQFLKFISIFNGGSGLQLFRGDPSFTNWVPIKLNANNTGVVTAPCE